MASCRTCEHDNRREIERQQKAGVPDVILAEYTRTMPGGYVSRLALGRHRRAHLGVSASSGRREMSTDLAEAIRDRAHERLVEGDIEPSLKDGLAAQTLLDRRMQMKLGEEWQLKIVMALTGQVKPPPRELDDGQRDMLIDEAEFRVLADGGDATSAAAARDTAARALTPV